MVALMELKQGNAIEEFQQHVVLVFQHEDFL